MMAGDNSTAPGFELDTGARAASRRATASIPRATAGSCRRVFRSACVVEEARDVARRAVRRSRCHRLRPRRRLRGAAGAAARGRRPGNAGDAAAGAAPPPAQAPPASVLPRHRRRRLRTSARRAPREAALPPRRGRLTAIPRTPAPGPRPSPRGRSHTDRRGRAQHTGADRDRHRLPRPCRQCRRPSAPAERMRRAPMIDHQLPAPRPLVRVVAARCLLALVAVIAVNLPDVADRRIGAGAGARARADLFLGADSPRSDAAAGGAALSGFSRTCCRAGRRACGRRAFIAAIRVRRPPARICWPGLSGVGRRLGFAAAMFVAGGGRLSARLARLLAAGAGGAAAADGHGNDCILSRWRRG